MSVPSRRRAFFEQLERREVFAPLPVLMVIADQRDFFYQEYGDTKLSLEEAGLTVRVAATTTQPSTPHWNSGQGATSGVVTPDLTLAAVVSTDYSAIVFVGGWGSSMYQYAFTGDYYDNHYDGNAATKTVVNNLINQFSQQNKYIAAVCHATTVLAWARVNGVSPLQGKMVSVPYLGSPGVFWNGTGYSGGQLQQHVQMTANGATPRPHGSVGNPATDADDVTVDGRIITGENNFSAREFGRVIATRLWAEDVPAGPVTQVGSDLVLQGTAEADLIVVSTNAAGQVLVSLSGVASGPYTLPLGGRFIVHAGAGADRIHATSSAIPVVVYGDEGKDLIFGSPHDDLLSGGDGDDRILGFAGDDLLLGGEGRDILDGGTGEDLLIGGTTSYDTNQAALFSIFAEWTSSASAATRRAHLEADIAGGVRLAPGTTVFADDGNCLLGGAGIDWILSHDQDRVYGDTPTVGSIMRLRKESRISQPLRP